MLRTLKHSFFALLEHFRGYHSPLIVRVMLALAIFVLCAGALSQQPSPTPSKAGQPPYSEAKEDHKETDAKTSDANKSSAGVNAFNAPRTDSGAAQYTEKGNEKSAPDWGLDWLTGAIVLVGVLQLVAFVVQAKRMGQTIAEMRVANRATKELIEVSKRTAMRQLRAYLCVNTDVVIFQDDTIQQRFVVLPELINAGQTPAHNVFYNGRADVLPYPLPDNFAFPMTAEQKAVTSAGQIGPGQKVKLGAAVDRLYASAEVEDIRRAVEKRLYMYGTVYYVDALGDHQTTNFCQSYRWRPDGQPLSENTRHHNDAT